MGGGSWTEDKFIDYSMKKGRHFDAKTKIVSEQSMFERASIHESLNPYKVVRECRDTEEHPNTIPVILALDVTGSMGSACLRTATALNAIITDLYKNYKDIEFMIMAIGDLAYDRAPIQASQFESDERIAEAIDNIYLEHGGGGNQYESYTAAWYFGRYHTDLDCWKRGKKGIIITLGDEPLNPYLPYITLSKVLGDSLQGDIDTPVLYADTKTHFDIFHIAVDDPSSSYQGYKNRIESTWGNLLGSNYRAATIASLPNVIVACIDSVCSQTSTNDAPQFLVSSDNETNEDVMDDVSTGNNGEISW